MKKGQSGSQDTKLKSSATGKSSLNLPDNKSLAREIAALVSDSPIEIRGERDELIEVHKELSALGIKVKSVGGKVLVITPP